MAKELYLYSPIYNFTAESLIASLEDNKNEDVVIRLNTPGGSVMAGWGIVAKMKEHQAKVKLKIDGSVASMGTFMLPFSDDVEALDVSTIQIHRADMFVETPEEQEFLDTVNASLREKFSSKINAEKLKEIKGVTLDDIFNSTTRINVTLTAKEAKEIGLINKVTKLNPKEVEALHNKLFDIAAIKSPAAEQVKVKSINMNIEQLKAEHPALYNQIVAIGEAKGVTKERDRVGAFLAFVAIDPEAVSKGIKEGNEMSQTAMAEFTLKAINAKSLKAIEADSSKDVKTGEVDGKSPEAKNIDAFQAEVRKQLNLK